MPGGSTAVVLEGQSAGRAASLEMHAPLRRAAQGVVIFAAVRLAVAGVVVVVTAMAWKPNGWALASHFAMLVLALLVAWYAGSRAEGLGRVTSTAVAFELIIGLLLGSTLMGWQDALTLEAVQEWYERGAEAPWSLGGGEVVWVGVWVLMFSVLVPLRGSVQLVAGLLTVSTLVPWLLLSLLVYGIDPVLQPYVRPVTVSVLVSLMLPALLCVTVGVVAERQLRRLRRDLDTARRLGPYRLENKLGEGGMGEVWMARHRLLARPAAVKLIRAREGDDAATRQTLLRRFEREVQATAQLGSPHTVQVFDYGYTGDGTFYYVMELLAGVDLETLVRDHGALPPSRAIYLLRQVLESLAEAHAAGLVHRDIKPANIMVCRVGVRRDFVKVLDFGLVKAAGNADEPALTRAMTFAGTPAYAAPEVARLGADQAVPASDLYSVGCLAHWLLTGRPLFDAAAPMEMLAKQISEPPRRLSEVAGRPFPADLERLVLGCLSKDPGGRPRDAQTLSRALAGCNVEPAWDEERAAAWWAQARAAGPGPSPPSEAPTV